MKAKSTKFLIILSILILANPNFNVIDIFPDFISYFILASFVKKYESTVPYAEETRSAFMKLGFITLIKLPATFVMLSGMSSGRDIVPLFALTFAVLELIFLYSAISNMFSALFYLGERTEIVETIKPFKVLKFKMYPDTLRLLTYGFFTVKMLGCTLPEFCLLSFDTDTVVMTLRMLYPILEVIFILLVLVLGAMWSFFTASYATVIHNSGNLTSAVETMVGAEKLATLEKESRVKSMLFTLSVLVASPLLSFDLVFQEVNNGVNILPRCIFVILLVIIGFRLGYKLIEKIALLISGTAFTVISLILHNYYTEFYAKYDYIDILNYAPAKEAYQPIKLYSIYECIALVAVLTVMAIGFIGFIRRNTLRSPSDELYSKMHKKEHLRFSIKSVIMFLISAIVGVLKCVHAIVSEDVQLVFTDASDVTQPVIASSPLPWLPVVTVALSIGLIIYGYMFISDIKAEIKMKYSKERA